MLIERINLILQVTDAHGGQYKYSGHTIIFPQDINSIAKILPRQIEYLDILIVKREGSQFKHCYFTVCRSHVMNALHYKIQMENHYQYVEIDLELVGCLPNQPTNFFTKLCYINSRIVDSEDIDAYIDRFGIYQLETHPSSFIARMPNAQKEIEELWNFVNKESNLSNLEMEWP